MTEHLKWKPLTHPEQVAEYGSEVCSSDGITGVMHKTVRMKNGDNSLYYTLTFEPNGPGLPWKMVDVTGELRHLEGWKITGKA